MKEKQGHRRYTGLYSAGTLQTRARELNDALSCCRLCPRNCGVNRLREERGVCNTGSRAAVSSFSAHYGEEKPISGVYGSGTIFFTSCNLLCNFCQNYDISHSGRGTELDDEELAGLMLELQERGCHNINLVTPTHVVPQIMSALVIAVSRGLTIPLVYNTGAYDLVSTLKYLEGIIDIYMPDFKFWSQKLSVQTCNINDYRDVAVKAISEMYRQAGDLVCDDRGIAVRGLLLRHLVMPGHPGNTKHILDWVSSQLSKDTYLNIMDQYYPAGKIAGNEKLSRTLGRTEFRKALEYARELGLQRLEY